MTVAFLQLKSSIDNKITKVNSNLINLIVKNINDINILVDINIGNKIIRG